MRWMCEDDQPAAENMSLFLKLLSRGGLTDSLPEKSHRLGNRKHHITCMQSTVTQILYIFHRRMMIKLLIGGQMLCSIRFSGSLCCLQERCGFLMKSHYSRPQFLHRAETQNLWWCCPLFIETLSNVLIPIYCLSRWHHFTFHFHTSGTELQHMLTGTSAGPQVLWCQTEVMMSDGNVSRRDDAAYSRSNDSANELLATQLDTKLG